MLSEGRWWVGFKDKMGGWVGSWRIVQEVARMMKRRYILQRMFLEAVTDTRSSFALKSILHGRNVLVKGMEKMVGRIGCEAWIKDIISRIPLMKYIFINLFLLTQAGH